MNVTQPQPCPHYPHLVRHECSRCSARDARVAADPALHEYVGSGRVCGACHQPLNAPLHDVGRI